MSASRSRVVDPEKVIKETFREAGYVDGWTDAVLADYRAEVAHELAEKIRADLDATGDWTCCAAARRDAAALIDPKKEDD